MQIIELTSVLSNKLDFLEVSRKGVSSLKVLLIEVEVSTGNILKRLCTQYLKRMLQVK